jgi:hypothetical protein
MPTTHRTLRGAYALACQVERERLRRIRAIRYGVVGSILLLLFSALLANGESVPTFIISLVLLAAALQSLATAAVLTIGDAWGWTDDTQPVDRETKLEAMISQAVAKLRPRPNPGEHTDPRVRVLPPLPPD